MAQAAQQKQKPKTAITPTRAEDFAHWYQQVIRAAGLAENAPVRGCMIIKPNGYAIWENIQSKLDKMIKDCEVENAYFPLLIPLSFIAKEAEHIDGFAKECAVVTHHRLEKDDEGHLQPAAPLQEPLIVRPTSETIIGETLAEWIQSYRDLPYKLNQWGNVMRWEMRPRLFLRTSEFLWQEGHNCFATPEEAHEDAIRMLDVYADLAESTLAMPVIRGEKTPDERFPGAQATYTIEAVMQDGKALQAGTSHDLGTTFSKSAGITYQGRDGQEHYARTTSWGLSTRIIGGMIMTHSDDDGLVLPPNIAPTQIVILPVLRQDRDDTPILDSCEALKQELKAKGLRVRVDSRDMRTPDKMWEAIKQGIPLRVEIGAREMEEGTLTHVRRDIGKESKTSAARAEFVGYAGNLLEQIQADMLKRARDFRDSMITPVESVEAIKNYYEQDGIGLVRAPLSVLEDSAFDEVAVAHSLSPRCIPFDGEGQDVLIGRSY